MPKIEIEYKYKIDDIEKCVDQLNSLGAEFVAESRVIDEYFIVPNNPEGRKYLRVREDGEKIELAYHYVEANDLTKEWEVDISDASIVKEILQNIGHDSDVIVDKARKKYRFLDSEIVVDCVAGLGNYMEIESPNKEELLKIENMLKLSEHERIIDCGYPDMIKKLDRE